MPRLTGQIVARAPRRRLGLVMTVVLGLSPPALASCPAFDLERTGLGYLGLEQQGRLTPADREAILKGGVIPGVPVGLWPFRGPAPLRVGLVWLMPPEDAPTVELDVDGDGTPEIVDTRIEQFGHVYAKPGSYAATVTVRRSKGGPVTYSTPVAVLSVRDFENELQARWSTFTGSLERRDLQAALECVHSGRRNELERQVKRLLGQDAAPRLPPIRFVELQLVEAVCVATAVVPGMAGLLEIRFVMDFDAVWRLGSLEPRRGQP